MDVLPLSATLQSDSTEPLSQDLPVHEETERPEHREKSEHGSSVRRFSDRGTSPCPLDEQPTSTVAASPSVRNNQAVLLVTF